MWQMELLVSPLLGCKIQPPLQNHRIIQHGKDSSCSLVQPAAQSKVSMGSDQLTQGFLPWRLHNVSGQLDYPCGEEVFTCSKLESCSFFSLCAVHCSSQQLAWDSVLGFCWKVLITWGCPATAEQCSHGVQGFSASHTAWAGRRLGLHKKLGGSQLAKVTPADPRDIPHNTTPFSAIKALWKKEEGGIWTFCICCVPKYALHIMKPCFCRDS